MKEVKIKGKREPITMAEWKDVKDIVKAHLKEYKDFYDELRRIIIGEFYHVQILKARFFLKNARRQSNE